MSFENYEPTEFIKAPDVMFQPKTANRFVMTVTDLPAFLIKKVTRPSITFGEIVLDHINTKRKIAGKGDWQPITMTLYDPILPSGAEYAMNWIRRVYQAGTGQAGYASEYKEDVVIEGLDPAGAICERWVVKGAYPEAVTMGENDWANEGIVEIELTLKYDWAVLEL